MPVKIVKEEERLPFEYAGGMFWYRRPMLKEKQRWTQECTNARGNIDFYKLIQKAVPNCLLGWDDGAVIDEDEKPIAFSSELALSMPEDFYLELSGKLGLSEPDSSKNNGALKNSKST
jgi:hypothetical protein